MVINAFPKNSIGRKSVGLLSAKWQGASYSEISLEPFQWVEAQQKIIRVVKVKGKESKASSSERFVQN